LFYLFYFSSLVLCIIASLLNQEFVKG